MPGATGWVSNVGDAVPNVELAGISFAATPTSGDVPLTVSFNSTNVDSVGAGIAGWNWSFGDGSTSTLQNPSHTYTNIGVFSVALIATNDSGVPTAGSAASITVSAPPPPFAIAFTANPATAYAPVTVSFTSSGVDSHSNAITSWNWNFGDGHSSTAQNPSHLYTTNGIFSLTLIATNNLGDTVTGSGPASIYVPGKFTVTTNSGTITITGYTGVGGQMIIPSSINGLPVTSIGEYAFNEKGLTSIFIPASMITLQPGAFQYNDGLSVYFQGNAPSAGDTVFTFSSATAYYLPGATGWSSTFAGITAIELAGINITATPATGVAPLTVDFTSANIDSDGNAVTNWNWNFGDGLTSTAQNPSHIYTDVGVFSVALFENDNTGLPVAESAVSITVNPPGTIAFTANPTAGYVPLTVSFASTNVDGAGHTISRWNWNFGDGSTSAAQNPSHTYTNTGTFSVALIATNDIGAALTGFGPASIKVAPEFTYTNVNGMITITGYVGPAGALTIPSRIDGLPVTSIGTYAFAGGAGLTSVTIPASVTNIVAGAFQNNPLGNVYFEGNAPGQQLEVFFNNDTVTVYYLPGAAGWSSTIDTAATVLWNPLIQAGGSSFGVRNNQFGFDITGTANLPVAVEVCTNLSNPVWIPLQTVTLTNGSIYFSEPFQPASPGRFYGLGFP